MADVRPLDHATVATVAPRAAAATVAIPAVPELVAETADLVSRRLRQETPSIATFTGLMAAYHMGWVDRNGWPVDAQPSKMVRSSLCLWACAAACGDGEPALPAALALEWVHNATLVHDDIQDGDRQRRSRETVWSVWGAGHGINAGDAMYGTAFERLLRPGPMARRRLAAGRVLAGAISRLIEGQCIDLAHEGRLGISPSAYLRMARAKTGALLAASLQMGAIMGGARHGVVTRLRRAGELLGLAFQVRDDWLGIWGDPGVTGKSRDHDLQRRKITYPVVAGYSAMNAEERSSFSAAFSGGGRRGPEAVADLRALLERRGAHHLAAAAGREFAERATQLVTASGLDVRHAQQFKEFARYVANRAG